MLHMSMISNNTEKKVSQRTSSVLRRLAAKTGWGLSRAKVGGEIPFLGWPQTCVVILGCVAVVGGQSLQRGAKKGTLRDGTR